MFANAAAYQRFMGRWSQQLAPLLVAFADPPHRGSILDVGSGTGALAFSLAEGRPRCRVLGIDPSRELVDYATGANPFPKRVAFRFGDAQRLRLGDAEFDSSCSLLVFNFIPDRTRAARELARVTKPGGCVSAAVWDYGGQMQMLRAFWDAAVALDSDAEKLDESNMALCKSGELAMLWSQSGLAHVEERALDVTLRFETFDDYWEPFLLGQGPAGAYIAKNDATHVRALRSEVKRRLAIEVEDRPFSLAARAWAVRGLVP